MQRSERDAIELAVSKISYPTRPTWTVSKVVPILSMYFVKQDNEQLAKMVGQLWVGELEGYPLWAIDRACAWWVSRKNDRRHRGPLPGDISERCEREMLPIRLGKHLVGKFDRGEFSGEMDAKPELTEDEKSAMRKETQNMLRGMGIRSAMNAAPKSEEKIEG